MKALNYFISKVNSHMTTLDSLYALTFGASPLRVGVSAALHHRPRLSATASRLRAPSSVDQLALLTPCFVESLNLIHLRLGRKVSAYILQTEEVKEGSVLWSCWSTWSLQNADDGQGIGLRIHLMRLITLRTYHISLIVTSCPFRSISSSRKFRGLLRALCACA